MSQQKKLASRYAQASASRPRTRTTKACDRCRFKKSKVGIPQAWRNTANNVSATVGDPAAVAFVSTIPVFTENPMQRLGESISKQWILPERSLLHLLTILCSISMSEILDVMAIGLRRLYSSCINNEGFPGTLSEQHLRDMKEASVQIPPTHAILEALGLITVDTLEKTSEEEQGKIQHDESYWHRLRPDRPLIWHSPENDAGSGYDSTSTSPLQPSEDHVNSEDFENLPKSATATSRRTLLSQSGRPSTIDQQQFDSRESDTEKYVRMVQNKLYIPSSDAPALSAMHANSTSVVDSSFHGSLYTTMLPPHHTVASAFQFLEPRSQATFFPGLEAQVSGPRGTC